MNDAPSAAPIALTERAARRINFLLAQENSAEARLRVAVTGGGCSGFQYVFSLDRSQEAADTVVELAGARVVIDEVSLPLLAGLELDWVESLEGSHFAVKNPNAAASCSCGSSFSV